MMTRLEVLQKVRVMTQLRGPLKAEGMTRLEVPEKAQVMTRLKEPLKVWGMARRKKVREEEECWSDPTQSRQGWTVL